ncbi:MaoC family dehydratase [Pseudomonas sp. LRF_L74]|uniref:MaoC family dehydratase n=1 Tax=Pseudomonas sp. LRF_L74 TaxID=3369422 RepID=UPI003F615303
MTATQAPLYLEDLSPGDVFISGGYPMEEEAILAFARAFDPQPFHLDAVAARQTFFQGLAASGWHTAAITMRLLVESVPIANGIIGAGSEIAWPRATRPGDVLRVVSTVKDIQPSKSRPDRGVVVIESLTLNQDDEVCQRATSRTLVFRRG